MYPSVPDTYKVLRSDFRDMDGIIARSRTIRKANPRESPPHCDNYLNGS
jgi:hypothetical protein